ncbi:hypothetical protein PENTCL1PPCAC_18923, partial [Pristionchus entomophagus]
RSLAVLLLLAASSAECYLSTFTFTNNCPEQVKVTVNSNPNPAYVLNPGASASQDMDILERNVGDPIDPMIIANGASGLTRAGFYMDFRVWNANPKMEYYIDISRGFDTGIKIEAPALAGTLICSNAACAANGNPMNAYATSFWWWVKLSPFVITFCP